MTGAQPPPPLPLLLLPLLLLLLGAQGLSTIASEELENYQDEGAIEASSFTSGCYFSAEYQGEFVTQVSSGNSIANNRHSNVSPFDDGEPIVQYSTISITPNAIPVWGYCHKRINDNVLLKERMGELGECIRCFRIVRRSRNILEVFSQELNRCTTNESVAVDSCRRLNSTAIFYRKKEVGGVGIRNEYCPFAGRFRFKYSVNYEYAALEGNSPQTREECSSFSSEVDNCPNGSIMQLRFRKCSFDSYYDNDTLDTFNNVSFECLGSWPASHSKSSDAPRYIALLDNRGSADFAGPARWRRPRYRCGLYHVDSKTAKTYLTLSSDSSCTQNLANSTTGFESFILSKTTTQRQMPPFVVQNSSLYPEWAQGEWQETLIVNGTMTFNDLNGYRSFTFVTVDSNYESGQYVVFSRDQCEQEAYVCLLMKQRSENVMEFATGAGSSPIYQPSLCNETSVQLNRSSAVWWTLSRLERTVESPCPITGEYTGQITDVPGWCAELSSNCNTRQVMYYKVYDCHSGELYEERTYLCLGQWNDQGVTYTYTMRNDTGTNECFVGSIVSDDEIYIKEAGESCLRNINPLTEGMKLSRRGLCYGNSSSPAPTIPTETTRSVSTVRLPTTVRTPTNRAYTAIVPRGTVRGSTTTVKTPTRVKSSSCTMRESGTIILAGLILCLISDLNFLIRS